MPKIEIQLKPSKYFCAFIVIVLTASVGIVSQLPLPIWGMALLALMILVYGLPILWYSGLLMGHDSITGIRQCTEDQWQLSTRRKEMVVELMGDSTCTHFLCVLRFKTMAKKNYSCVVFHDSLDPDLYRRFLVQLHHSKAN